MPQELSAQRERQQETEQLQQVRRLFRQRSEPRQMTAGQKNERTMLCQSRTGNGAGRRTSGYRTQGTGRTAQDARHRTAGQ